VLAALLAGCGANGGDPVAGGGLPAPGESGSVTTSGPTMVPDDPATSSGADDAGSGSNGGGSGGSSDGGGSGGNGSGGNGSGGGGKSGDDHGRKIGLPKSIRIPEIGEQAFRDGVVAACGSPDGAPGCLTVTYRTVDDDGTCGFVWESDPPKVSDGNTNSIVPRGARITATISTGCGQPDDTTTSPPADDSASTSDTSTAPEVSDPPASETAQP
jgi:hypothetical protein